MSDPVWEAGTGGQESATEKPFQVVVKQQDSGESMHEVGAFVLEDDEPLSLDDIEAAYLRALENADLMESVAEGVLVEASAMAAIEVEEPLPEWTIPEEAEDQAEMVGLDEPEPVPSSPTKSSQAEFLKPDDSEEPPIGAEQVLEALLFVGGGPLPTKKLLDVLGGSTTSEQLDELLMQLNTRYLTEGRPYEIRLQTGGYVLQLREEFEAVRSRTYGHGPKDVKLAQDALEVLALIAYRQPATKEELEEMGRPNLGPILRQLLRRQLVVLERDEGDDAARYRTTPRFLGLFGLQSLADLPQAGDFNFK